MTKADILTIYRAYVDTKETEIAELESDTQREREQAEVDYVRSLVEGMALISIEQILMIARWMDSLRRVSNFLCIRVAR